MIAVLTLSRLSTYLDVDASFRLSMSKHKKYTSFLQKKPLVFSLFAVVKPMYSHHFLEREIDTVVHDREVNNSVVLAN